MDPYVYPVQRGVSLPKFLTLVLSPEPSGDTAVLSQIVTFITVWFQNLSPNRPNMFFRTILDINESLEIDESNCCRGFCCPVGWRRTLGPGDPGFDASRPKYFVLDMFPRQAPLRRRGFPSSCTPETFSLVCVRIEKLRTTIGRENLI